MQSLVLKAGWSAFTSAMSQLGVGWGVVWLWHPLSSQLSKNKNDIQTTWRMAMQGCEVRQTSIDKLCLVGVHHTNHGMLSLHMFMHLVTNGHGMLPRPCPVMHRQSFTTMLLLCAVLCMCFAVPISNTVRFHHAVVKIIMQRSPREFAANAASPASASRRSRLSSTRLCG